MIVQVLLSKKFSLAIRALVLPNSFMGLLMPFQTAFGCEAFPTLFTSVNWSLSRMLITLVLYETIHCSERSEAHITGDWGIAATLVGLDVVT